MTLLVADLGELSQAVSGQPKVDIIAGRRHRVDVASDEVKVSGERPTCQSSGCQLRCTRGRLLSPARHLEPPRTS
jgi:hypothetical protein